MTCSGSFVWKDSALEDFEQIATRDFLRAELAQLEVRLTRQIAANEPPTHGLILGAARVDCATQEQSKSGNPMFGDEFPTGGL